VKPILSIYSINDESKNANIHALSGIQGEQQPRLNPVLTGFEMRQIFLPREFFF
jgi:hypothetical protein